MSGVDLSLPALIERVKAVKRPDRILDALIKMRFDPHPTDPKPEEVERIENRGGGELTFIYKERDKRGRVVTGCWGFHVSDPVTRNLATVEAFVERHLPGCYWHIAKGKVKSEEPLYGAAIWLTPESYLADGSFNPDAKGEHSDSAALAFLLAALRALQVKEEHGGK